MAISTITYANKVALNENQDIADINKVKADDMNEIKSVVNNNATETSTNTADITKLQTYSTSEVDTGCKWIDNKTIYRKVIIIESLPNNTGTSYDHNISNIGTRWLTFGFWEETSGTTGPIPMYYKATADQITQCYISDTKIYVQTNANYSSRKGYFVVEYTKTS